MRSPPRSATNAAAVDIVMRAGNRTSGRRTRNSDVD